MGIVGARPAGETTRPAGETTRPAGETTRPAGETTRPRAGRKVLRTAVPVLLIAAAFGFVLPHVASYRSVWASVQLMTWPYALLVATAAVPAGPGSPNWAWSAS